MKLFYNIMAVVFFIFATVCLFADDIEGARYGTIICLLCCILQKEYTK